MTDPIHDHADAPSRDHAHELRTLWRLVRDTRLAMLTHRHPEGGLYAHPLTTQNRSLDEGELYFFVSRTTELGQRLLHDAEVNVAYADPHKDHYVSITGQARVVDDLAHKERLFNALNRAWFPKGPGDPNLELVAVRIVHAEYWDITESKVTQLFKMATAAVTGQPPTIGRHEEVHFG